MGPLENAKIIIVIICLLLTNTFIYYQGKLSPSTLPKNEPLAGAFTQIGPWNKMGDIPLPDEVLAELELDDFLFRTFTKGDEKLTLYIGYYNSSKKVGAAHDPLVCFPGQGWKLGDIEKTEVEIHNQHPKMNLQTSKMTAEWNGKRLLLLYWFQAQFSASTNTFMQKIMLFRSKILRKGEVNAFIRISIVIDDKSTSYYSKLLTNFTQHFYPLLLNYIEAP